VPMRLGFDHRAGCAGGGPGLVISGNASLAFMPAAARALSKAMPYGQLLMLKDQAHDVDPRVLAPVLTDFFTA
jgi:hypothetical protein